MICIHRLRLAVLVVLFIESAFMLHAKKYDPIIFQDSEMKTMNMNIFTITRKTSEKGVPFSAVVDFDDKDGYTQNSNLEVVVVSLYKRAGEKVKQGDSIAEISSNALNELYFALQNTTSRYQIAKEVERKDKDLLNQGVISQRAYQTSYLTMNELRLKMHEIRSTFSTKRLISCLSSYILILATIFLSFTFHKKYEDVLLFKCVFKEFPHSTTSYPAFVTHFLISSDD